MPLEKLGGGFVRLGPYHREGTQVIAGVGNALWRDLLGLTQGAAETDDGALVFVEPRSLGRDAFLLFRLAGTFR
jgi:hypothetical protein